MNKRKFLTFLILVLISINFVFAQEIEEKKYSVGETRLILMKSIILPGWGEHSIGSHKRGFIFNTTEMTGWLAFAAFTLYKNQTSDDMKAFAADHAGIDPSGKDNQFFTDIGNYMNIYDYNEQKRRYRQVDYIYDENDMYWAWDTKANKKKFDDMRLNSRIAKRNASLVVTTLVLNRLLSVIDIASLTKGKIDNPYNDNLDATLVPEPDKMTMSINFRF